MLSFRLLESGSGSALRKSGIVQLFDGPQHPQIQNGVHQGAAGQAGEGILQGELRFQAEEVRIGRAIKPARVHYQGERKLQLYDAL